MQKVGIFQAYAGSNGPDQPANIYGQCDQSLSTCSPAI